MTATGRTGRADALDSFLVIVFLIGIYLEYAPPLAAGVPLPAAPAGAAGLILLLRHHDWIEERQLFTLLVVLGLYLASTLFVPETQYLSERLKGFLQISYSFVIGYGLFITLLRFDRQRLGRIFLAFCFFILIGCALENYTSFRAISDSVRAKLFQSFLYDAQLRDETLYGGIRPKLFSSEPSYVAYALTLYAFAWYILSPWRLKFFGYLALLGCGMFLVRSPTLVLGGMLIIPYELLLAGRSAFGRTGSADMALAKVIVLSILAVAAIAVAGDRFFGERMNLITSANDISFFYRIIGPALVGWDTIINRPIAGAGLTGEEAIATRVSQLYVTSSAYAAEWQLAKVNEVLTNFFWHHWIYLGLAWGLVMLAAITRLLRSLHAPSIALCWIAWAVFGQASGAYVSPKPWATLLIVCAASILHYTQPEGLRRARPQLRPQFAAPRLEPHLGRREYAR